MNFSEQHYFSVPKILFWYFSYLGVDIDQVSKEELVHMLGREYHDMSTSAMSFVSSSSHKSVSDIIFYLLCSYAMQLHNQQMPK